MVAMGVLQRTAQWLGFAPQTRASAPAGVLPPTRPERGHSLDTVIGLPGVYRSISILVTVAGMLTLEERRRGQKTESSLLVDRPNAWTSQRKFVKRTVINMAGTGTAYWRIYRGPNNEVADLDVLNPHGVTWTVQPRTRTRTWHYTDEFGTVALPDNEIKVLRLLELPGRVRGLGPIEACRMSLAGALDLRDYAARWFGPDEDGGGAGIPSGVLSTDKTLFPEQADAWRERWRESVKGHGVAVLGQGLTYEPILINPEDAQFLQNQNFTVTDIARMFGIPATYLLAEVNGTSMTYQNLEQVDLGFVRTTLMGYLSEIEDALTSLLPLGREARFNFDDYLRPDSKTAAEIDAIYLDKKVVSPEEVRRRRGIPGPAPATMPALEGAPA